MSDIDSETWMAERQAYQFYKEHAIGLSDRHRHCYRRCLREWVEFICQETGCSPDALDYRICTLLCIGDKSMEMELHPDTVMRFLSNLPCGSVRTMFQSILYTFFSWLVVKGMLIHVPISPPKRGPSKRKIRPLDMDDIQRFTYALCREPILKRGPVSLLLASGVRVSSLCRFTDRSIQVGQDNGLELAVPPIKRSPGIIVPLPDVQEILDEYLSYRAQWKSESESLFLNSQGTPLQPKTLGQWVAGIGERAGCSRRVTPHDMRRMCATIHAQSGNLDMVRRILNHKREQTTLEYISTPNVERLHGVVSQLPAVLLVELRSSQF